MGRLDAITPQYTTIRIIAYNAGTKYSFALIHPNNTEWFGKNKFHWVEWDL